MLRWPEKALRSLSSLFRQLQNVDVFVEDENSEVFYSEFLGRLTDGKFKIVRVFPLRGRENVERACLGFQKSERPTLFIVDGDLDAVYGTAKLPRPLLFRLQTYCIENYLFCPMAATELLLECEAKNSREQCVQKLDWEAWQAADVEPFIELFAMFAVAYKYNLGEPMVQKGLAPILTNTKKGVPRIDAKKLSAWKSETRTALATMLGPTQTTQEIEFVMERIAGFRSRTDAISGKAFLLPLLRFHLDSFFRLNISASSFKLRLARHCSLLPLADLKEALHSIARGGGYP